MEDIKGVLMHMGYNMKVINMTIIMIIVITIINMNINTDLHAIIAMDMMIKAKSSLLKNKRKNVAMDMGIIKSMIITMLITIMNMDMTIMITTMILNTSTSTCMDRTASTRKNSRFKTHSAR
jgi:hypothetical protein